MDLVVLVWMLHSLIQALANLCPGDNWFSLEMECYLFLPDKVNWTTARNACAVQNSHLVRNENAEIDAFLKEAMKDKGITSIWTGANDLDTEGVFVWEDNDVPVNYTDWEENSPNNYRDKQHCVRLYATKSWNDLECYKLYAYACQRKDSSDESNTRRTVTTVGPTRITPSTDDVPHTTSHDQRDHRNGSDSSHTDVSQRSTATSPGPSAFGFQSTTEGLSGSSSDGSPGSSDTPSRSITTRSQGSIATPPGFITSGSQGSTATPPGYITSGSQGSTATPPGSPDGSTSSAGTQPDRICFCCSNTNVTRLTNDHKQEIIAQLKGELSVAKANTSVSRRKLISVYDSRPSSVAIGGLGCALLALTLGLIVVPDMINFGRFLFVFTEGRTVGPDIV